MITATRRLCFSAGHRLLGHEGGCRFFHGHNYVVFVQANVERLDAVGRVIDFAVLKEKVGGWIAENWDHSFLLNKDDQEALDALVRVDKQPVFLMGCNPTAENIADFLLRVVCPQVLEGSGVEVISVIVHETENCHAEASL